MSIFIQRGDFLYIHFKYREPSLLTIPHPSDKIFSCCSFKKFLRFGFANKWESRAIVYIV